MAQNACKVIRRDGGLGTLRSNDADGNENVA